MRRFFYIGPNKTLKSGFSIKFWKIERRGKTVTAYWGPAKLDHLKRKILIASWTRNRSWTFASIAEAKKRLTRRVNAQLKQGYYRLHRHT